MNELNDRIAALTPEQRAIFEQLRKRSQKKTAVVAPPPGAIPKRAGDGPAPLSFDQERLWFLFQLDPRDTAYNIDTATRMSGPLDVPALTAALNEVVRRHESWRTVFPAIAGRPVQVVRPALTVEPGLVDLRQVPEAEREAAALRVIFDQTQVPFDLEQGPLVRTRLIRLGDEEHICLLTVHHIVTDWVSFQLAWRELAMLYQAFVQGKPSPLPELAVQYSDFAVWQREWMRGEVLQSYLAFWVQELAGAPHVLELPTDRPRPAFQTTRGAAARLAVPLDRADALRALGRQVGATTFMAVLALYDALLFRYTGQEKVLVGSPNANRNREEIQPLLGFFLTQLTFATDLSGDPPFRELLRRARTTALRAYAHQDLPFGKLVEAIRPERDASRAPLVQVNLLVLDAEASVQELPDLTIANVDLDEDVSRFDMTLGIFESSSGIGGFIEHNRDLFDPTTMDRMARAFELLVAQVGEDPDVRLSELRLLSDAGLHQLLSEWNDTAAPDEMELVDRLFEARVEEAPEAVALATADEGDVTYRELKRRADELARHLWRLGVRPESRVGLCVERGADLAAGILGIWKAGGAYVPLDPAHPEDRLAFVVEDAGLAALLTREKLRGRLPETDVPVVLLDRGFEGVFDDGPMGWRAPGDLAYVIYTSGTTGQPKGVMVEHGSLANLVQATQAEFGWTAADRIPALAPFSFDIFLFELLNPLVAGGTCELVPLTPALDLPRLMAGLASATRLHAVPALMRQIAALARAEGRRFPGVRTVFVGGDAVPPELPGELREVFPEAEVRILYGPTEGTILATSFRAGDDLWPDRGPKAMLGRPLANVEIRLYDRHGGLVPPGVPGELWIGGAGVTRGYLNRHELTQEKYPVRDGQRWYRTGDLARRLPDGLLEFLGRADDQVKVRGFRIELGEIEAALAEHPAVRAAVVLARPVDGGDKRLVAYVVPAAEPWDEAEVRAFLAGRLPEYMVPGAFVPLGELPLTSHGKVDRRALLALDLTPATAARAATRGTPPRTPAEEVLAEIWSGLLAVEQVDVHDNFFRLGGDSILSIQVVARAREAGLVLTPRQVFENQTLAGLAAVAVPVDATAEAEEGPVEGEVPLTPVQRRFFEERQDEPWHFNQALLLEVRDALEPRWLAGALAVLAERHDALRMRVEGDMARITGQSEAASSFPLTILDLSLLPEHLLRPAVESAAAQAQASLDLERGPIARGTWLDLGQGRSARLLLAIHHLAVDAVSWQILLGDLQTAYGQLAAGASISLPGTTSWKRWSERLKAYARSQAVLKELEHWLALPVPVALPYDLPGTPEMDTAGAAAMVSVELDETATAALLRDANAPYRTRVDDLLLTALAQAFARWTGEPRLVLELEGHGREEIGPGIDLSRTVGWFTTVFPVALDLAGSRGPREAIKAVKEQLRAIPGKGLGYGLLRYFGESRRLAARPEPQVGFNYLGQLDAVLPAGSALAPAPEPAGPERSLRARRRHRIDVDALVWEGRLRVTFTYASRLLAREALERLAAGFSAALEGLIAHCLTAEAGGWTPSDVPLAQLSPAEVDALLGSDPTVEDVYPLAPLQSGMLFHTLYTPGSEIYFEQLTATLRGPLDVDAFARAWQAVADRQPVLRTAFVWEGLKRPLQIVRRGVEVPWSLDWQGDTDAGARFRTLVAADQGRGFDLAQAPLIRLALVRTGPNEHRLLWSFHHLLFDGWCFSLLFREVFVFYEAFRCGETPALEPVRPYRDYLAWLDRQDPAQAEVFWRARLAGVTAPTPVPFDHPEAPAGRTVGDFREVEVRLPGPLARDLTRVAQEGGITLNTLLQGAWALLLARWSGSPDVIFGAVAAGRPADLPGVESMVGLFINTLPVRAQIDPVASVLSWLRRLQEEQVEQRAFEWSPLSGVQRWSEVPPGTPLFESVLVFENYPIDPALGDRLGDLEIADVRVSERTNYPLTLAVVVRDELLLRLGFDARVTPETAERILAQLEAALAAFAADPERTLGSVPVLPGEGELRARAAAGVRWPAADASIPRGGPAVAPRDAVEEALCRIWRSVLRLDRIGIHDDFFRLGGDSILSLQIVARARQEGLVITPRQIFEHPTVAALAAVALPVSEGEAPATQPPVALVEPAVIEAVFGGDPSIEDLYPLAPLQRGMLLHALYAPETELYLEQLTCALQGPLDAGAFRRVWQRVVDRHPALRTAFLWQGLEEPLQVVRRGVDLPWVEEDWRGLPGLDERLRERIAAEGRRGYDLAHPPLQRAALLRTGEDEHRFVWSFHHLLFDGWCFSLLFREVFAFYQAFQRGEDLRLPEPRPYRDYIAWLEGRNPARSEEWWRQRLAGFEAPNPLPLDAPAARPGEPGASVPGEEDLFLTPAATASLEAFAQGRRLTLNTVVQGAWALLLARYGAGQDVVFGTVVSGRPPELPGVESMVGLFINTVPMRLAVEPEAPVAAWLRKIQEAQLEMRPHEHVPLAEVQAWSELPAGEPLFQSLFVFENYPFDESLGEGAGDVEVRDLVISDRTDYPLSAVAIPASGGRGLLLKIAYDHRAEPATVRRLLRHLETLLAGFAAAPDRPLEDVSLLSAAEQDQLLTEWAAWDGWPASDMDPGLCVHQLFERQAVARPNALAVLADGEELTYGELNQQADRLAHRLRALGVVPEVPVALWVERSAAMITAVLGILKAGGAYVPIDPETPLERVVFLLGDSGAPLLLTQESLAAALPEVATRVLLLGAKDQKDDKDTKDSKDGFGESLLSLQSLSSFDHLAYMIYTSGSTGLPKGVMVPHGAVAAYTRATCAAYGFGPGERALQFASLSFDASAEEIFTALASGASLVVRTGPPEEPSAFLRRCGELGVTILDLPTAYWHQIAAAVEVGEVEWPSSLRLIVIGGERALPERWASWGRGPAARTRLFNSYGPTEATIAATVAEHPGGPAHREVSIGRPLPGVRVYVLDPGLRPVPEGAPGELLIGGVGLARGYLGDPARTAERFVPDPCGNPTDRSDRSDSSGAPGDRLYRTGDLVRWRPDGTLEFAGRLDTQVKVRGFRIELGEVEAALAAHPAVLEAAAGTRADVSGSQRLVAWVVWQGEGDRTGLQAFLHQRLPAWMVPSEIVELPALPVTPGGKIDRRALLALAPAGRSGDEGFAAPQNPVEEALAGIWSELLGVERIGRDDDFFALGGHSLLATQLVSRVRRRFGIDLPLHGLFELRTLADLAQEVLRRSLDQKDFDALMTELDEMSDEEALALLEETHS